MFNILHIAYTVYYSYFISIGVFPVVGQIGAILIEIYLIYTARFWKVPLPPQSIWGLMYLICNMILCNIHHIFEFYHSLFL
jgi:hypothetical protein